MTSAVSEKLVAFSKELASLVTSSPKDKEQLRVWYEKAKSLQEQLTQKGGIGHLLPHVVWHYLADADIRMRDEAYRSLQNEQMRRHIASLEKGVVPEESELDVEG